MSKPKHYWFGYIQKTIRRYPDGLRKSGSMQSHIAEYAIERAITDTKARPDGEERMRLLNLLYWRKPEPYMLEIAADMSYISPRTAQKWNSDFVYTVARYMGHL